MATPGPDGPPWSMCKVPRLIKGVYDIIRIIFGSLPNVTTNYILIC